MHDFNPNAAQPVDGLLASYAAGGLTAPLHALVASHLEISPRNRGFVASLEAAKASAMEASPPKALSNRDVALNAIFAGEAPLVLREPVVDRIYPSALLHYFNHASSDIRWRFRLPGIKEYRVTDSGRGDVSLFWIRAGRKMPSHTHEGQETTLVLRGGFTDPIGHYRRGDIAIADAELDHHPTADADEDCICFAVTDAPLTMTNPIARIFRRLTGH